jgi:exopolysaccharide production protein ExoZ
MDGHQGLSNILLARHGCFFALGTWLWISTTRPLAAFERAAIPVAIMACIGEICLRAAELPHPAESPNWMLAPVLSWSAATTCVFCFSRTSGLTMFSGAKRIRIIGLMTYPLYLVHNTVGNSIIGLLIAMGVNKWAALTFGILSMIFLSWIVCEFCEPPIRKMLAMVFDRFASGRFLAPSTKSLS